VISRLTLAALRAILRLYPARFCDRFADDVIQSVRRDLRRAGEAGALPHLRDDSPSSAAPL
jgi:hypothetical protein